MPEVTTIRDLDNSLIDHVRHQILISGVPGAPIYNWSHQLGGSVDVNVVDPLRDQHAALAADQQQLRAAENLLAVLSRYEKTPDSDEAKEAMKQSAGIRANLRITQTELPKIVLDLAQRKVPGLYASLSKTRRNLLAQEYETLPPTQEGFSTYGQQIGSTSWSADLQGWIAEALGARRLGDFAREAAAWRKAQMWQQQTADRIGRGSADAGPYQQAATSFGKEAAAADQRAAEKASPRGDTATLTASEAGRQRGHQFVNALRSSIIRIVDERLCSLLG